MISICIYYVILNNYRDIRSIIKYVIIPDVQLQVKTVKIPDSPCTVEAFVYDCAGQETFQPLVSKVRDIPIYYIVL